MSITLTLFFNAARVDPANPYFFQTVVCFISKLR